MHGLFLWHDMNGTCLHIEILQITLSNCIVSFSTYYMFIYMCACMCSYFILKLSFQWMRWVHLYNQNFPSFIIARLILKICLGSGCNFLLYEFWIGSVVTLFPCCIPDEEWEHCLFINHSFFMCRLLNLQIILLSHISVRCLVFWHCTPCDKFKVIVVNQLYLHFLNHYLKN